MRSWRAFTEARCARPSVPISRRPSRPPSAVELAALTPDPALVARFSADLEPLVPSGPLGLAVSGGADSMALLLLAAAARPGAMTVLSVDHGLRAEAASEVGRVAALCARLDVPHRPLRLALEDGPNLQSRARDARYAAMAAAASERGIAALATAHHADDQAETVLMRLSRGSGVGGLSGIRPVQPFQGVTLVRPLLGWTKEELEKVCRSAGVEWAQDPSNADPRFDRAAMRTALRGLDLDPHRLSRSAAAVRAADEALDWVVKTLADRLQTDEARVLLEPSGLPSELVRRLLLQAMARWKASPRGPDLERAMESAANGRNASLCGLLIEPLRDGRWAIAPEPPRRA